MARRYSHHLFSVRYGEPWVVASRSSFAELKHIAGFVSEFYDVPCWLLSLDRDDPEGNKRSTAEMLEMMMEHLPFISDEAARAKLAAFSPAEAGND